MSRPILIVWAAISAVIIGVSVASYTGPEERGACRSPVQNYMGQCPKDTSPDYSLTR